MPGISHKSLDADSFLALQRFQVIYPVAQDLDYVSSTSDGGSQAAASIATAVAGDTINRSATGKLPLPGYGRRLVLTQTDASGSNLNCKVRVTGYRFGKVISEIVDPGNGTQTVYTTNIYDEVTSIKVVSISNNAASDTLKVGIDDSWVGLPGPIKSKSSIRSVLKISSGTPDAAGPKVTTDLTAAMVKGDLGGLDLKTLYSSALAVTDIYLIEFFMDGNVERLSRAGTKLG